MNQNKNIDYQNPLEEMATAEEQDAIRSALNRMDVEAPDVDEAWDDLRSKLGLRADSPSHSSEEKNPSQAEGESVMRWDLVWKVAISIAAILVVSLVLVHGLYQDEKHSVNNTLAEMESPHSAPSNAEAETPGVRSEENGVAASGQAANAEEMLSLETGAQQDKRIVLSDGTRVWLNAESKLEYPKQFGGADRKVRLEGEAYFEVKHDAKHPFRVETSRMVITDLGTAFDVKAYEGKPHQLVLVSGSVAVAKRGETASVVLKPDQMASLVGDQLSIAHVDTYPLVQWKNGLFYFHDASLMEVMKELGRWYHIKVVFENKSSLQTQIHFVAERSESLEEVVKQLNDIEGVEIGMSRQELTVR